MSDIVDRLRDDYQKTPELCAEAADEIERLDSDIAECLKYDKYKDKEIERLHDLLARAHHCMEGCNDCSSTKFFHKLADEQDIRQQL